MSFGRKFKVKLVKNNVGHVTRGSSTRKRGKCICIYESVYKNWLVH